MKEMVPIADGDFVLLVGRWHLMAVHRAIKVSPAFLFYDQWAFNGTKKVVRRMRRDDVVFSGSEEGARTLAERLKSSFALHDEENRKSAERLRSRNERLIAEASGTAIG